MAQWIGRIYVEQKLWGSSPTGRRYQLGGFLIERIPLYSLLEETGMICPDHLSEKRKTSHMDPAPCGVSNNKTKNKKQKKGM